MEIINLDMVPGKKSPVCHASQFDEGRVIRFNLYDSGLPFTLDGTESITFEVRKPDGNIVISTLTNTSDSYVDVVTTEQMTAVKGANLCEVRIEKGETNIGSLNVIMAVEMDPTDGGIASASEIDNLRSQVNEMVAEDVAEQYDSANVIFDNEPTDSHGIGYTVTSEGIKTAIDNAFDYDNTASGSIVHITDGADNVPVKSLVSQIVAVETGNGEKSPDNPYSISGFAQGVITVTDNDQITNTYTFNFGQTVYGGYFDNKGNLVVTHKVITIDDLSFSYESINTRFVASISDLKPVGVRRTPFLTSVFYSVDDGRPLADVPDNSIYSSTTRTFYIKCLSYTDTVAFKTAFADVKIVYPIEPITLSITSQDIPTLLGENNIFSNCGDVEVNYYTYKSNDILEFVDSEIGKKNGTNIPIEENSQDSIKDYIDENKANKTEDTTITLASGYTLVSSSCGKTDRLVHLNFNVEKSGGFSTGWQIIGTTEFKPNTLVYCPLWNVTNGVGNGEVRVDTDGTINFYVTTAGELSLNANIGYITD